MIGDAGLTQAVNRVADALFTIAKAQKQANKAQERLVDVQETLLELQESNMAVTAQLEEALRRRAQEGEL